MRRPLVGEPRRLELVTDAQRSRSIARAITQLCRRGEEGDGLVGVLPVADPDRIRDCRAGEPGGP